MTVSGLEPLYSYTTLPEVFFKPQFLAPVTSPRLVMYNSLLAQELGLETSCSGTFLGQCSDTFSPIAMAYAGHQFGHLTMLGDGRAVLLTEHLTPQSERMDIHFKGSGRTPFSRGGDGKAALGPMLREFLISEAMAALGIPTTRSLAVDTTGEPVYRETVLDGAVLTRVAKSHIRVGTFEFAALQDDPQTLKALADYTMARHYPACLDSDRPYVAFLDAVIDAQAFLVAQWMLVGFVHGVMNTDNVSIAGETIDYGPCAFMDTYDPKTVFSSIDRFGRYAYGNQPQIMAWNLARFAETLLPILDANSDVALSLANECVSRFFDRYSFYWKAGMKRKLGLEVDCEDDQALMSDFLQILYEEKLDYTHSFLDCCIEDSSVLPHPALHVWHQRWLKRLAKEGRPLAMIFEGMARVNPVVIPRNFHVESSLKWAESGDLSSFLALLEVLRQPFLKSHESEQCYQPGFFEMPYRTFCGT